ncbi:amylo-alpha-1,6-glucosidase [Mesorhizobium sp. M1A.F.Ca.IN.020.06.1.1]|uniref:amylo-alpha-1,6-glucosidase n=1 Tax=unclassified Mesorhizobium TaxID=325217 RepID=UPI000FCBEB72|nr:MULTISPECIES: glycogen debranching N-terminal domain-containing protein [unclassified Mesorhizobium]RUU97364.1 amylo-alpha-1,6-glucosidase [Mesorhizobium sp. M1A.F.Ca.IN.020.03.2.1]RUV86315.1 amylo-alpha-1,6-glucosidase [Mesorhizobium sp. M1A.F.Ca.IN.020.32.1.1]RUW09279.1 amylo-alpha-1,6-glucosidase [Mesorhizobium sp. M1A.F.Ca.IN.022.05.2.1]RUW31091.1 amylo-alpha-1,6-glucosidase [Mesorhizobium sp. M1A.F.Ca.IN.020.06.1.1]RWF77878.1 MAG: amylo-alpha-1,6-glucosidase [Mesorhizobium sp.]
MQPRSQAARSQQKARQTPDAQQERRHRVLAKGHPAMVDSIAGAITVKNLDLYYILAPDAQIPVKGEHGFGLYFHDCRFLGGYEMTLGGLPPIVLASTAQRGYAALFELANPDLHCDGGRLIPKDELGIRWERILDAEQTCVREVLTIQNFGNEPHGFPLALHFGAGFEDIFNVRGLVPKNLGRCERPAWRDGSLHFVYHGADHVRRTATIGFLPAPDAMHRTAAEFQFDVSPGERRTIAITIELRELSEEPEAEQMSQHPAFALEGFAGTVQADTEKWLEQHTKFDSDSLLLNSIMDRSLRDLAVLRSDLGNREYFAAGVPWYVALFGRDSLIVALEMLAFQPEIAAQTLRLLAGYQGRRTDRWREEQPGKILHELRVGELARAGNVPHARFYCTVDATPLFLLLLGRYAAWTGDVGLFRELREPVEKALGWIAKAGDGHGEGYVKYRTISESGLVNQGWKDSADAIVRTDGSIARPPIALVEVQGYVFAAKHAIADLYERIGERNSARQVRGEAEKLRTRFNRDFWCEDLDTFALALEARGRPVAVVSSNPGHALWSGIADRGKGRRTVRRLMQDDMFNGWGVRTLSSAERRYNPVGYHLGTVWPHDNALLAAGCRRYGEDGAALRTFTAIVEAAMHFRHHRLPEAMAGFQRNDFQVPVHYPVACHPQAWAAGAVPFLVTTCLGLEPDAFANRLRIVRPRLPDFVSRIELRGLRVGEASADLEFMRTADGAEVNIQKTSGQLSVEVGG